MKTMTIEKQLVLSKKANRMLQLEIQDHLVYRKEDSGIRAVGQLFVQGLYEDTNQNLQKLQEVLEMDVLAPWEKLTQNQFELKVNNYHADIEEGDIVLTIELDVYGLKDEKQEVPQEMRLEAEVDDTNHEEEQTEEENEGNAYEEFEDLFEDADTTYTSYRMVVAQMNDTYDDIASRYGVDVMELKDKNHHRTIEPKMLVILPAVTVLEEK